MKNFLKRLIPVIIAIALILAVVYFVFYPEYQERYEYSNEYADLMEYFKLSNDTEVGIILQDAIIPEKAKFIDGAYYFDLATVYEYFNSRFYVDERENLLLYSLPDYTVRTKIGSQIIDKKDGEDFRSYKIAFHEAGILYIAVDFIKDFTNFSYDIFENPGRMQVYTQWGDVQMARINRDTQVRYRGGVKSEILVEITSESRVMVLEEMETWAKVKTMNGFIGYVEKRRLGEIYNERQVPVTSYEEPVFNSNIRNHKISLGWHYIGGPAGNDTIKDITKNTEGLNVISPTWFFLSDNNGNFDSFASHNYVKTARELGLEVWALVENMTNNVDMLELLSATSKRTYLIKNLIESALEYEIDGINVDFEELRPNTGIHFIQFIRELSIPCRELGIVLSVDNYVPYNFNDFYNRPEQGVFADYVVIMGYDEHYRGSDKAGSVASIDYVENGIKRTVEQVPANKVINGVPFYTRIWETKGGSVDVWQTVGMAVAQEWLTNRNLTPEWDEVTCQYYAEYTDSNGVRYQVWLENSESLRTKFNVMNNYEIGGVAFWQLGQETADVWEVVLDYLTE